MITGRQNESIPLSIYKALSLCQSICVSQTRHYQEVFNMFASKAMLYDHESLRRTAEYVTRKIAQSVQMRGCCDRRKTPCLLETFQKRGMPSALLRKLYSRNLLNLWLMLI